MLKIIQNWILILQTKTNEQFSRISLSNAQKMLSRF